MKNQQLGILKELEISKEDLRESQRRDLTNLDTFDPDWIDWVVMNEKYYDVTTHLEKCRYDGLQVLGNIYFNEKHGVPFKRRIQRRVLNRWLYVMTFVNTQRFVTVRQIFYFLTQHHNLPNTSNAYQRVKDTVTRLRYAGLIRLDSIADVTDLHGTKQYNSIEELVREAVDHFRSKWWDNQDQYVEVFLEKRALANIVYQVTERYGILLSVSGGEPKIGQVNSLRRRLEDKKDKDCVILFLSDFDPKGDEMLDTLRDMISTLNIDARVEKIALNDQQVRDLNLPKSVDFKQGDTSLPNFIAKYGIDYYVELDALSPTQLRDIVEEVITNRAIAGIRLDLDKLEKRKQEDSNGKARFLKILEQTVS